MSMDLDFHMIYVCPECGQMMESIQEWRQHLNSIHGYSGKKAKDFNFIEIDRKYHECKICLKRLAHAHITPVLLQYHHFTHLSYVTYKCRYCDKAYTKKRTLALHLGRTHSQLMEKVDKLHQSEKRRQELQMRHPKFNKEFFVRFLCPQCGKLFQRFPEWQLHIDEVHLNTSKNLCMHRLNVTQNFYCDQCSDVLYDAPDFDQLRRHHFSHLPYSSFFQCAFCMTNKPYKTELFLHFINDHKNDYLKYKQYIVAPEEWAGPAKEDIMKQIQIYIANENSLTLTKGDNDVNESKHANFKSTQMEHTKQLIPTKENVVRKIQHYNKQRAELPKVKDILQKALQDSCINFDDEVENAEYTADLKMPDIQPNYTLDIQLKDDELENICSEIFEEISDDEDDLNSSKKIALLSQVDVLKKELQKYINYLCPECLCEFRRQSIWRSHVFEQHNLANIVKMKFRPLNTLKTAYLCLVCCQVQRTSKNVHLQRHYFQHMPHQNYLKCSICMQTKSSKSKMLQHLEQVHRIQITNTPAAFVKDCPKNISQPESLQCLECDENFVGSLQMKNHLHICSGHLVPLPIEHYNNLAKNMKLLKHLQTASQRIDMKLHEINGDKKFDNFKVASKQ